MLYGLYVNYVDGKKRIVQVDETGGYYDPSQVLWDERSQGPMPQEYLDANAAVNADDAAERAVEVAQAAALRQSAIDKLLSLGLTLDQVNALLS